MDKVSPRLERLCLVVVQVELKQGVEVQTQKPSTYNDAVRLQHSSPVLAPTKKLAVHSCQCLMIPSWICDPF